MKPSLKAAFNQYYTIHAPVFRDHCICMSCLRSKDTPKRIDTSASLSLRSVKLKPVFNSCKLESKQVVELWARQFKRLKGYDFVQYSADEHKRTDENTLAYVWTSEDTSYAYGSYGSICFGACCFRWREWTDAPHGWALQWVYLHPFIQGNNVFENSWSFFIERHGDFLVESPYSKAMWKFLEKKKPKFWVERTEQEKESALNE